MAGWSDSVPKVTLDPVRILDAYKPRQIFRNFPRSPRSKPCASFRLGPRAAGSGHVTHRRAGASEGVFYPSAAGMTGKLSTRDKNSGRLAMPSEKLGKEHLVLRRGCSGHGVTAAGAYRS
jgi:hypothetical protein